MVTLTPAEARVVWTYARHTWAPSSGYAEWMSAMNKLCDLGGGYCCRECIEVGTHPSKLGGFLCDEHKAKEQARYQTQEAACSGSETKK